MGAPNDMNPPGETDKVPTLEDLADKDWQRGVAAMFGINLKPTAGDLWDILEYLAGQGEKINDFPEETWAKFTYPPGYQDQVIRDRTTRFWAEAATLLAPYAGYGADKPKEPELPGDPLKTYFDATDRFFNTMLGPFPEATYLGIPRYKEAFDSLLPTSFDEFLKNQEQTLRMEYEAQIFSQMQPMLQQYGTELAALPSDQRYIRTLELSTEMNLGALPTYQSYLEQQLPRLQTQFRYLNPLPEAPESTAAFGAVFKESAIGEQVTPQAEFFANREKSLQANYQSMVREQLRSGATLDSLPTLEAYYKTQRPLLERSFAMSGPQYTGKSRTGALAPPRRIL